VNLLYLNPTGCLGGAERVLLRVMAAVRQAEPGARVRLLACADGPLLERARRLGVDAAALPLPAALSGVGDSRLIGAGTSRWGLLRQSLAALPAAWDYAGRLHTAIAAARPDLIHSNGIKTHLLARLAAPRGTPVVWHVHDFYGARPLVGRLLRWSRKHAAGAVAISEAVAHDVRAVLPGLPVAVVRNAVDVEEFSPGEGDGAALDRLAGLPPAPPGVVRVGLVAAYARWKGHDVFLEAAARVVAANPGLPVRFYVVGGPIYQTEGSQFSEDELRAEAARLGLTQHVGFAGFQAEVVGILLSLDVAVHASTRPEPFGLAIIEAMACGRAVVAVGAGGAAELFRHEHDALGVPPGDADALAAAIATLACDADRRRTLGANARRSAVARFSTTRLGGEILQTYHRFARGPTCWRSLSSA
jgi:glycosyltransferase involved in cell wall biosynthesis